MFEEQITTLQKSLQEQADPKTKAWWQNYVKGSAPFLGVKMPVIRTLLREWYRQQVDGRFPPERQVDLALALFAEDYTEDKLAGTLFLQEILLPASALHWQRDLDRFATLFDAGLIYDWNVCDWFCVKVLGPLIEANGLECATHIAAWRDAENLWRARASLVAFVKVAPDRAYYPLVEASCAVVVARPERFAKTAVGWILREISRHEEDFVRRVLDEHIQYFSAESLKNAIKYLDKDGQQRFRQRLKNAA